MDLLHATAELASRLDRLRPGVLDGPPPYPSIARRVAAEPLQDPAALVVTAGRLRAEVAAAELPAGRRRYLEALLVALRCRARLLAGDDVGYLEQVRDLFGVVPRRSEPDELYEAHRRLAAVLPGRGPLAARMRDHRAADVVPADRLADAVAAVVAELRGRTRDTLGLPAGEHADVGLVGARPWTAFTRYRGGLHSRVSVATTGRVRAGSLLPLLAHEVYPGHHLQYCRAEIASARPPGAGAATGPQPAGARRGGCGGGRRRRGARPRLGPGRRTCPRGRRRAPRRPGRRGADRTGAGPARPVRLDAALMRHVDGAGPDAVLAHLARWLLVDDDRRGGCSTSSTIPMVAHLPGHPTPRAARSCPPGSPRPRTVRPLRWRPCSTPPGPAVGSGHRTVAADAVRIESDHPRQRSDCSVRRSLTELERLAAERVSLPDSTPTVLITR
ncbi:hypothetical protein [Pseudonocardia sp. ICBG601]|uniref:hypothetical protein n=1 Tax=Pseudonocardia sp. ICBG601 TaxID=2846759 RepID=UPI001CF6F67C|nr:hypothetical protein [Pseudonocardia sp. ICBG601]